MPDANDQPTPNGTPPKIIRLFGVIIFTLVGLVILLPFAIVLIQVWHCDGSCGDKTDKILDWAKTVLAPVVGFGSAVVGYYFGTRSGSNPTSSEPGPSANRPPESPLDKGSPETPAQSVSRSPDAGAASAPGTDTKPQPDGRSPAPAAHAKARAGDTFDVDVSGLRPANKPRDPEPMA